MVRFLTLFLSKDLAERLAEKILAQSFADLILLVSVAWLSWRTLYYEDATRRDLAALKEQSDQCRSEILSLYKIDRRKTDSIIYENTLALRVALDELKKR